MGKNKNDNKANKKFALPNHKIFIIFLGVCLVSLVFCFRYYTNLHTAIREESKTYLQEICSRIGTNINRIIQDNYNVLYTMTSVIAEEEVDEMADIQPILKRQKEYWDYENIMLIDESGKMYTLNNEEVFVDIDESMREDILNRQESLSTTQIVNNKEYILFSVPLQDKIINGKKMVALAASYAPSSLDEVLSMSSFGDQAYSQIITKAGTTITRSSSKVALQTGYNVFSSLKFVTLDKGTNLDKVREEIQADKGNQIGFTSEDGNHYYMVYTPIKPDEWYQLTFVPADVINERSDTLLASTFIICAVITATFAVLSLILIYIFSNTKRRLERMAYVDEVTGGNTAQRFYELAKQSLSQEKQQQYALVYTNIENFKVLNEQLGRQDCDLILRFMNNYISKNLREEECMGRISADNFGVLLQYDSKEFFLERFSKWVLGADEFTKMKGLSWGLPSIEMGVYVIDDNSLMFPQMLDRAKLALRESPRAISNKFKYAFYNDDIRRQMFREKQLEDMMEYALEHKEFQVYLQPKYRLPEEAIGGAEALVRWESESEGMIFPNDFIPLFERNGFIIKLDLYVFEEVCKTISRWVEEGHKPVKISVNCSRVHLRDDDFLVPYIQIAEQYMIERSIIEIELTESIVFDDTERLIKIIKDIETAGFGCSMDDFGSGYSSLNLIRSIPVDTLKIDRVFFDEEIVDSGRTEAVVESIILMAKALSMETVAEGVENRGHVDMLKTVGCDYIQGYFFAKPMKINEFEALAFQKE